MNGFVSAAALFGLAVALVPVWFFVERRGWFGASDMPAILAATLLTGLVSVAAGVTHRIEDLLQCRIDRCGHVVETLDLGAGGLQMSPDGVCFQAGDARRIDQAQQPAEAEGRTSVHRRPQNRAAGRQPRQDFVEDEGRGGRVCVIGEDDRRVE